MSPRRKRRWTASAATEGMVRPRWCLAVGPPSSLALQAGTFRVGFDEYLVLSFDAHVDAPDLHANAGLAARARLTEAEREVATLVTAGLSNDAIARRRKVSLRTIAKQVSSIYRKLAVRSRRELVALRGHGAKDER